MLKKNKKILLIGGGGNLGEQIIKSKLFKNLHSPNKNSLNILNSKQLSKFLKKGKFEIIINCAAMARMKECEKNISKAIDINVAGTLNLVKAVQKLNFKKKKEIRFVHLSSDAVYSSLKGNYSERDPLGPKNNYGWTKLASEFIVKILNNHVIIRTRFFNKYKIKFKTSAKDIFTSSIEVMELVKNLKTLIFSDFVGVVNVGSSRNSDYLNYKKFRKNIKPIKRIELMKKLNFFLAKDASMNISLLKRIKAKNK